MSVADMLNTYSTVQNKEELADVVSDLFADEVPFFTMAKKYKVRNQTVEWTEDSLASPAATAVVEGATVTYTDKAIRSKNTNYTHIRLRSWEVTHSQEASDPAGVKSEVKRELMKSMKELLRDFDKIMLNSATASAGTTATGRTCGGIQGVISTNTEVGSGTGSTSDVALDEDTINSLLDKIWTQGGNPRALFCNGYQKRVISQNFTAKTGFSFNIDASARKAIQNINQYEGSFGTLDVIPDRQHMKKRVTVVDPDFVRVGIFRDIEQYKGAKTSSSYKGWVEAEMTLNYGNEAAHGSASYLTTSFAL